MDKQYGVAFLMESIVPLADKHKAGTTKYQLVEIVKTFMIGEGVPTAAAEELLRLAKEDDQITPEISWGISEYLTHLDI